jgi:multidrug efflux pump subunit AcrA (membrane-fusion protein)
MQYQSDAGSQQGPGVSGTAKRLAIMFALGVIGAVGIAVSVYASPGFATQPKLPLQVPSPITATQAATAPTAQVGWVASAPGRVEPRTGQIRISAGLPGRVTDIAVRANDRVTEGEVLIRLDDKEARARLTAAEAEAAVRKRERDAQPATPGREDVRKAEDAVFAAERALTNARFELDEVLAADRRSPGAPQALLQATPGTSRFCYRPGQRQHPRPQSPRSWAHRRAHGSDPGRGADR